MNSAFRFKKARDYLGFTQQELADKLEFKQYKIKDIETEKQKVSPEIAEIMEKYFSINGWWLLTGKGEMLLDAVNSRANADIIEIPYFEETYGAMGVGGLSYDAQPTVMSFDSSFLKSVFGISNFKNLHIINAVGDSMAPTITSGELLLVNPFENENHTIKDQGVYVILSPQGILVKRIKIHPIKKEWKLVSDNPNEEDLPLQEDEINHCTVIGRVVGHFDRI
jgi:phage repressor protein C with HTH and peptisase S24 domain